MDTSLELEKALREIQEWWIRSDIQLWDKWSKAISTKGAKLK